MKIVGTNNYLSALIEAQQEVIEQIALGTSLKSTLSFICSSIEKIFSSTDAKSSILILEGNRLTHGAAPSLPKDYTDAIDGVEIGLSVGSCGSAAFTRSRYVASDINTDPKWENYKGLALTHQLQACWSTPIISTDGHTLGTFAVYYDHPCSPTRSELDVIDLLTHLTGLAIEKNQAFTREKSLNEQLARSNTKLQAFTSVLPDVVLIYDHNGKCVDTYGHSLSPSFIPTSDLRGNIVNSTTQARTADRKALEAINQAISTQQLTIFEYELRTDSGLRHFEGRLTSIKEYLPNKPEVSHVLWVARDISDQKAAEETIQQLAYYDPLTNLPNRRLLLKRLSQLLDTVSQSKGIGALLYLDLNNFKGVNDSLGHSTGDQLLIAISHRLKTTLKKIDTIARIGGDEFVVLFEDLHIDENLISSRASDTAKLLLSQLKKPFKIGQREFRIGASIGITFITPGDIHADEILKRADTAMYSAKREEHADFCFFDPELHEKLKKRFEIENELGAAIQNGEIATYFQPKISPDNKIVGAEALVRWFHPEKGPISPIEFIQIAEEIGLIDELQNIVVEDACSLLDKIFHKNLSSENFNLSVNISAKQFRTFKLKDNLRKNLEGHSFSPNCLTLELTESMLVENLDSVVEQMHALKELGFRLSIDDFGTGYSSLAYLQTFPIDEIKIDKSFVDNMFDKKVGTGIVDAILSLAKHLNFNVVVEGVEKQEHVDYFSMSAISAMQGYFFDKPMPADKLLLRIENSN